MHSHTSVELYAASQLAHCGCAYMLWHHPKTKKQQTQVKRVNQLSMLLLYPGISFLGHRTKTYVDPLQWNCF